MHLLIKFKLHFLPESVAVVSLGELNLSKHFPNCLVFNSVYFFKVKNTMCHLAKPHKPKFPGKHRWMGIEFAANLLQELKGTRAELKASPCTIKIFTKFS